MDAIEDLLKRIGILKQKIISPLPDYQSLSDPQTAHMVKKNQLLEQEARDNSQLKMKDGEPAVMGAVAEPVVETPTPTVITTPMPTPTIKPVMQDNTPAIAVDPADAFIQRVRKEKPNAKATDDVLKSIYKKYGDKILEPTPTPYVSKLDPTVKDFIDKNLAPIAKKYDIPLSVMAGQFIQEGGLTSPGAQKNNFFNLGAYDRNPAGSFAYQTPQEGVEAYAKLISGNYEMGQVGSGKFDTRYSSAYKERKNPTKMVQEIKKAGYASDPYYVENVTNNEGWRSYQ
jgi:flagellum-specific peptidoglycan hydrolase FlgJ